MQIHGCVAAELPAAGLVCAVVELARILKVGSDQGAGGQFPAETQVCHVVRHKRELRAVFVRTAWFADFAARKRGVGKIVKLIIDLVLQTQFDTVRARTPGVDITRL